MYTALLAGFVAAVATSALGLLARLALSVPYPPQTLFDRLTQLLGTPRLFQMVHAVFGLGEGGKVFAFTGVALLWLGGLSLLGLLPLWTAALIAYAGSALLVGPLWAVVPAALYAAVRAGLRPVQDAPGRRATLGALGGGALVLIGGGAAVLWRSVAAGSGGRVAAADLTRGTKLPVGVTPQKDFYYVSKNLEGFDPKIDEKSWRLAVGGLVKNPSSFSLSELKALAARDLELTLSCISNPVGGVLISNGVWTGFPVKALLDRVGVQPGAKWIVWKAADGYTESLPLGQALEEDVMLVYHLNGEPLSQAHGFPLRVLIPNRYGMKQPRWITEINLSATEATGYWAERGWSRTAYVVTLSRFDAPDPDRPVVKAGEATTMRGVAFAGTRPITRVEVSTDGEKTWRPAALTAPRTRYAWTLWSLDWTPPAGSHQLAVRAYADGVAQDATERDSLPEGATGLHRFIVTAS